MKRSRATWVAGPALLLALAACGGGGQEALTVEQAQEGLREVGCAEVETEQETDDSGVPFTLVGCQLGATGAVVVNIVDASTAIRDVVCSGGDALVESADLPIATGPNWAGVVFDADGTTVSELAEALGGEATTVGAYCA